MDDPEYGAAEYLCYQVVRAVHEETHRDLPETEFNKQCYLVYKKLQEEGVDAELPVYWYEHGIMVDLDELLDDFLDFKDKRWSSGNRGTNVVIVDEWEEDEFDIERSKADQISEKAVDVAKRFGNVFDTSVVKDETYEKYGNTFVQTLNEARYYIDELEDIDRLNKEDYVASVDVSYADFIDGETSKVEEGIPEDPDEIEADILDYLDELVETYPEDTYQVMQPQFRQWESISRQLAMNHMFSQLSNFMEKFWVRFSRGELRIEHNENISQLKVWKWKRQREEEIEELEDEIHQYRQVLLENREPTDELSTVADSFSQAVRNTYSSLRENGVE